MNASAISLSDLFLKLANMSISASWLVLAVLVLRLTLKKAPKWLHVLLWGLVGVRLVLPFSIESVFSLVPNTETIPKNIMMAANPAVNTGITSLNNIVNPIIAQRYTPNPATSANPLQISFAIWANIWVLGMIAMLVYAVISYIRLRRRVGTAVRLRDNIYQSEHVASPFVLGILRPCIYLPFAMDKQNMAHVIAHEQTHIHRRDHWWKPLGFLLLTVYWFNPLLWLAYILLCRDIELACDEKVIQALAPAQRADYSQALLACSVRSRQIAACPLAFGEVGVKARVKSVLYYKKPTFWLLLIAVVLCIAAAVCFLTDPVDKIVSPAVQEYIPGGEGMLGNVDKDYYESIHADFAIGADRYGRAVFKEPYQAFDTMLRLYRAGIALIETQNNIYPISYTNFNAYKLLGAQMTTGTDTELEQAKFVSKFLDIYENSFERSAPPVPAPAPTTEPETSSLQGTAAKEWFDYYGKDVPLDAPKEIALDEIVGVNFRWTGGSVESFVRNNSQTLFTGMPVWNTFFADLTGDNYPDICATTSFGSGLIDTRFVIYDYINGVSYTMADRGNYDYSLYLQDGVLCYRKTVCGTDEIVETGYPVFADDTLQLVSDAPAISKLEQAISHALLERFTPTIPTGSVAVESHMLLASQSVSGTPLLGSSKHQNQITVYLVALTESYTLTDGQLVRTSGGCVPTILTFNIDEQGEYTLFEYWQPRDGSYYADDIHRAFPADAAQAAIDRQAYLDDLTNANRAAATEALLPTKT